LDGISVCFPYLVSQYRNKWNPTGSFAISGKEPAEISMIHSLISQ